MSFFEKMANKMAEKACSDPKFQQSWQVHMKAFGPILSPAFEGNAPAKVHLTAALNSISRGDCKAGLETLKKVQPLCRTDADHAALFYFMGLGVERLGDQKTACQFYMHSCQSGHSFYLPYMTSARDAQDAGVFDVAEENFRKAIEYLAHPAVQDTPQLKQLSFSARSNLGSCLTMMHRFEEAEAMLNEAAQILPGAADIASPRAILFAAMGNSEKAQEQLGVLEQTKSSLLDGTYQLVGKILTGSHAQFAALPPERSLIAPFWRWFTEAEQQLIDMLRAKEHDALLALLTEKLSPIFPFMERDLEFGLMFNDDLTQFEMEMADFYVTALHEGYKELLDACPEALQSRWTFKIIH